jgi:hypothetical protein
MKYIFYPNVHFIKGYLRSILYESDRSTTYLIPNCFEEIFDTAANEGLEIENIESNFLDLILQNDLIFEVPNDLIFSFPKPKLINYSNLMVSSLIIEYSLHNVICLTNNSNIFLETCFYIKLNKQNIDFQLLKILLEQNQSDSVEFGLLNIELINLKFIDFINSLDKLIVINCFFDLNDLNDKRILDNFDMNKIIILERNFGNYILNTGIRHFYEAHNNHTYFNNKLFLNSDGIITIYEDDGGPNINLSICSTSEIENFINSKVVKELWFTKKSNTFVCKDCENRFFCIDKRTPKFSEIGIFHEIECNYNPYIAKWKGEEGYLTLSECGIISNETQFSINHEKIAEINKVLWSDED